MMQTSWNLRDSNRFLHITYQLTSPTRHYSPTPHVTQQHCLHSQDEQVTHMLARESGSLTRMMEGEKRQVVTAGMSFINQCTYSPDSTTARTLPALPQAGSEQRLNCALTTLTSI